jgi:hypothetical protein
MAIAEIFKLLILIPFHHPTGLRLTGRVFGPVLPMVGNSAYFII